MTESLSAIQPTFFNAALQLQETAVLDNAIHVNTIGQNGFLVPANPVAQAPQIGDNQVGNIATEGLLNLNNPTLALFNEIELDPQNLDITGNLNAQQLQELGILKQDAQSLQEALLFTNYVPLNDNVAATLDLSLEAQTIAASDTSAIQANIAANAAANANATATANNALLSFTPTQLQQIGQILGPVINQPLTPELVDQIQLQLEANQINPIQLSLSTLLLVQNYIASLQNGARDINADEYDSEISVDPVAATDAVAVEDSAILA